MRADRLEIKYKEGTGELAVEKIRCTLEKWQWYGKYMGEQYVSFSIQSEKPIPFAVGDYCEYRGQVYTLNYIPSVKQQGHIGSVGNAFVYDSVKMDSCRDELGRTIMLDITPTTGDYEAYKGTNYTGSAVFSLYCGETTFNGRTLTPVCALAAKMQANMDRAYPTAGWKFLVDTTTTHEESGKMVLNTHTDEKALTFDNTTVAAALAMVKDTFDLDFVIIGRMVYIGYTFNALTGGEDGEYFYFGYGKGYADKDNQGKALFQLQRTSNSSQKIVTRLRALGSTKNMPYRYYNKKYSLSQALFPTNLQLPDTFATKEVKAANNIERKKTYPFLRDVLGDTNDAYIDKNDDCMSTVEGLREECARWDGSNSELEEIYPTIYEATYGELRAAQCADMDGTKGASAFPNHLSDERIDEILGVEEDANIGDGIMSESNIGNETKTEATVSVEKTDSKENLAYKGDGYYSNEYTVLTASSQYAGDYNISESHLFFGAMYLLGRHQSEDITKQCKVSYVVRVYATDVNTKERKEIYKFTSVAKTITNREGKYIETKFVKIPDYEGGESSKITLASLSDVEVTVQLKATELDYNYDQYSLSWYFGNSKYGKAETETQFTPSLIWDRENSASTFMDSPFHIVVKDMGFDFVAAFGSSESPKISMKSGMCVAREFEIGDNPEKIDYVKDGKTYKAWRLTLKRCPDKSIYTYYPSSVSKLAVGDNFVLLNIEMPEVYILAAETKLLVAATKYLADNCNTRFEYQPSIDDIYLQRNYDLCEKEGRIEDSIYWKLYDGVSFPFYGIPESEDEEDKSLLNVVIDTITIKEGEGLTPKVDIKLTDEATQGTIQKLSQTVSNITNGSIFNSAMNAMGGSSLDLSALKSVISQYGAKNFLSKVKSDTAAGLITFIQGLISKGKISAEDGADFGVFTSGLTGTGGMVDAKGNAELNSLYVRQFISAPKFVFNQVNVTNAEQWNTNGYGTIESVDLAKRRITLKLEENEYGSVCIGDICRGIFADIGNVYGSDSNVEGELDDCNFVVHRGFFTAYFYVRSVIENSKGRCVFEYGKKSPDGPDPCAFMDFAQYGSFNDESRQSSIYFSSRGRSYIEVLDGVKTWEIQHANRVCRYGWLGNLTVEYKDGRKVQLKGNGLFAQNNIYFGGNIEFLQGLKEVEDLKELATAYDVSLSQYQSVVTVDDMGNVINGLYTEDEAKTSKQYRISTAVFVRKGTQILLEEDPKNEDVTEGHYRLHTISDDCSTMVENSTVFVTGIRNIKDGVADTEDDATFDYDEMRKMSDAYIQVVVDLEGKTTKTVAMPIRIQHDSLPFMVCDLTNQAAQVAWNTKTGKYIGLPIQSTVNLTYHNEPWEISECKVVGGMPSGLTATITRNANGKSYDISINGTFAADTLPQVSNVQITVIGRYAGANYEYTRVLTIAKSADVVTYDVVPSADSIVVDKFDGMSASLVYCDVYCTSSDDKRYKLTSLPDGYSLKYGIDTDTPTNSISPGTAISVTANNKKVVFALYDNNGTICDMEDVPVLAWGKDGKGIEYIFFLSHSETPPTNPTPSDWRTSSAYQSQTTEYVPTWLGWTDDPSGVSAAFQYEYVAIRTSINGVWQPFSDPALHDHYGKHAPRATVSDNIITIPTDSKGNALIKFEETINFMLLVDAKACTISGITKSGSLTNVSCSISSSGGSATISCSSGAALGNNAQTLNFTVVGTLDGASYQDTVTVKIVPNVTGEDGDGYEYVYFLCDEKSAPTTAPVRSNGTLTTGWEDDVPTFTDEKRYIYVAWRTGMPGEDGTFSKPKLFLYKAKDGVGEVSAYQMVETMPTLKPTTVDYETFSNPNTNDLGNGWTKQIVKQGAKMVLGGTVVNVSGNNSAWTSYTDGGYTWWKSAAISNSETTSMRISFTTSEDNMRVTFYLKAYSESYDKIALSTLDSSTINSNTAIGGNGVSSGAIYFDVEKAGTHYVIVQYSKDSSVSSYLDCGLVRMATNECYVLRYPPIYRCHGTVEEKVITWGDITKETGDQGDKGDKGDKGDQGEQGDRGYNGCIMRTTEWASGKSYVNQETEKNDDIKYIDFVYLEDPGAADGWRVYQCLSSHTSSSSNKPGTSGGNKVWFEMQNIGPIFAPFIIAKGAAVKFAQGQQFNIMENNTIWGSFRHVPNDTDYAFWIGGYMGSVAPFAVTKGGKLVAANAEITGKITATSGTFDNCTIKDTCTITKIDAVKGTIGGFNITQYGITSADGVVGIGSDGISLNKNGVYVGMNVWNCLSPIDSTLKDMAMFRIATSASYISDVVEITSDFMVVKVPIFFTLPKYADAKRGQLCQGDKDNHVYIKT